MNMTNKNRQLLRTAYHEAGIAKDGRSCNRRVDFSRKGNDISFGEETVDSETTNIMLPIREAISARSRD